MSYQENLFDLDVMQDRSGRLHSYPPPPKTRGECRPRRDLRALPPDDPKAERCECYGCPHNLIGEIARIKSGDAVQAIVDRYELEIWDTCALDIADDGGCSYDEMAPLLGISRQRAAQVAANAAHRFRQALHLDTQTLEARERKSRSYEQSYLPVP